MKKLRLKNNKILYLIPKAGFIILALLFIMALVSCSGSTTTTTTETYVSTVELSDLTEVYDKLKYSVFRLDIKDSNNTTIKQGTGFILDEDGTFITNAHVLRDSWKAEARFDVSNTKYIVEGILHYDDYYDFAIGRLKIDDGFSVTPVVFTEDYNLGDDVYSVGYPNYALQALVTKGNILSTEYTSSYHHMTYIRSDSLIKSGSSGGVLVNEEGHVLGITSVGFTDRTYGAIRYVDFSDWESHKTNTLSNLTDFFHPHTEIVFDKDNIEDYYEIEITKMLIFNDINTGKLTVDYEINIYPKTELERIDDGDYIFLAIIIDMDYYFYRNNNISNEISKENLEVYLSININRVHLSDRVIGTKVVDNDVNGNITNVDYSYRVVYAEGEIVIYE